MSEVMEHHAVASLNGAPKAPTDADANLAAAKAGEPRALARLYDRHAAVVLSICRTRLRGRFSPEVDDASQETFLRAFRLLDRLEPGDAFRPWLYAIARRVCAERLRAGRRRHHYETRAVLTSIDPNPTAPPADAAPAHTEALARLDEALARLPERERLAIHLYYLDSDPTAAAHEALGLSRSAFYKTLARARMRLAAMLREGPACTSATLKAPRENEP